MSNIHKSLSHAVPTKQIHTAWISNYNTVIFAAYRFLLGHDLHLLPSAGIEQKRVEMIKSAYPTTVPSKHVQLSLDHNWCSITSWRKDLLSTNRIYLQPCERLVLIHILQIHISNSISHALPSGSWCAWDIWFCLKISLSLCRLSGGDDIAVFICINISQLLTALQ